MTKFTVLRGFCLGVGIDALPGQVIELDNAELYIRQGRIKPAPVENRPIDTISFQEDDFPDPPLTTKTRKGASNARN